MNKIYIYVFCLALISIFSCKKDEDKVTMSTNPGIPVLTNPGNIVLTLADSADYVKFSWKAADFGFSAAVSYTVQVDLASNNFSSPVNILTTTDLSDSVNIYSLDNSLLSNNYDTVITAVKYRIMAIIKGSTYSADTIYSDAVSANITPFNIVVNYSKLYLAGSWSNNWTFNSSEYIISAKADNKYEGYLYIDKADYSFKFSLDFIGWKESTCIGDAVSTGTSGTLQIGSWGGNNINVTGVAGYYKFNANLKDATYTVTYTDWAIAGSFNSWADKEMTYSTTSKKWTATVTFSAGDTFKFKLYGDSTWALNYGDTSADGKLDSGGTNISVTDAGTYTVTLNLSKYPYTYKLTKN